MPKKAIIIGAGPAGLTAAWELLKRTDIKPIILEKCREVGGISKTVDYKGNKMDFGPHRFFSKSDRVMNWWTNIMPLHTAKGEDVTISYQNKSRTIDTGDFLTTEDTDGLPPAKSMLVIPRLTRIYFLRRFFAYPIQLSIATLGQLGIMTTIKIVCSYLYARLFPRKPENSLEDFMINKFGSVLYHIFFKDYTEKVWGMDCNKISAEWGAQRIKGVSLSKAVLHAAKALTKKKKKKGDINQKDTETSLIEQFLYPAQGAGAMWEEVARQVEMMGGKIVSNYEVKQVFTDGDTITGIEALNTQTGQLESLEGDYFISTMPIQELIAGLKANVPEEVKEVAAGLIYRDFVYAGVLVKKMTMDTPKDSWIYIQEKDVKVARMQVYNNWGPYMVADPNTVWLGLEYFCTKGDEIWNLSDEEVKRLAVTELIKMDLVTAEEVLDATVNRMEKTYPAYFGTYDRFDVIREYLDNFRNLFLVGRNGMHKYNNADHSMLTAMVAVDNICEGVISKDKLWAINTEHEYHEEKMKEGVTKNNEPPKASVMNSIPASASIDPQQTFRDFLIRDRRNKRMLLLAGFGAIIQFVIFKYLYPYPSFIHGDSFVYINAAYFNLDVNNYAIGYSKFLRLFSVFSSSDTGLIAFQYIIMQGSTLFFLFTLFYFYKPSKFVRLILFGFVLLNPMTLYLSNYVSSDSLFITLSLIWFTILLWIINRPTKRLALVQAGLLLLVFTVRYNALYYPIIATLAFMLSRQSMWMKIASITTSFLVIACFILYTSSKYKEITGRMLFTPFSGWQMANNALYAYRYVDSQDVKPVPKRFQQLDKMVRHYFDTSRNVSTHPVESLIASSAYMWTPTSPLQLYMKNQFEKDSTTIDIKRWSTVAPLYADYGTYLIKQYPLKFAKYFLWPNAVKYYTPPGEFLETYNMGTDSVQQIAQVWFGYKTNKVKTAFIDYKVRALDFYPILSGVMNVVFIISFLFFIALNGLKGFSPLSKSSLLVTCLWIANFSFSVFASPVTLRYQVFPILLFLSFALLLVDYIYKRTKSES